MFASLYLLAFGFGNLAMLGWLSAAAAPLLIHLWNRHRYREAPWAAMQFLLAAMRRNSRRLQVQQWLLMAVRMLIMVLVVAAAAEPFGEQLVAGSSAEPMHRIIVLDASYSMAYETEAKSAFSQAKHLAAQLVRTSHPGDVFTVIQMAIEAEEIVGPGVVDHHAVASRIGALEVSQSGADLGATLALIQQSLSIDTATPRLPARKEVVFITDLQRAPWAAITSEPRSSDELKKVLQQISTTATIALIDVGPRQATNLAITSLTSPDAFATPHRDVTFDVTLRQFGTTPLSKCRVELLVDQAPAAEQTIDVPANGDATVRFRQRLSSVGDHAVGVRASGDPLKIDNSRWLVTDVQPNVRVLCVEGRPNGNKYLASALNPSGSMESAIQPTVVDEGAFADVSLAGQRCVFLCNVGQLTATEAARLTRFVEAGGGLVVFLGDRVEAANYNLWASTDAATERADAVLPEHTAAATPVPPESRSAEAANASQRRGLLPATLGGIVSNTQAGLDPLEYHHPIVAPFRGRERAGLLTTPVAKYIRLKLPTSQHGAEVAAAMRGGDPFIVASALGRGRVVVVATDASLSSVDAQTGEPWTSWPTWPSFLPIVRELLSYAAGNQSEHRQVLIGTSLSGDVPGAAPAAALKIHRPNGQSAAASVSENAHGIAWSYSDTTASGIYSLEGLPNGVQHFAVNVDTAESDLTKVDPRELPTYLRVQGSRTDDNRGFGANVLFQSSWTQPLLWAAFLLLMVEALMAWQFGRGVL